MCADIHDGQEHKCSVQGPDTDAQDQPSPYLHIRLATHGRSIQLGQNRNRHTPTPISIVSVDPLWAIFSTFDREIRLRPRYEDMAGARGLYGNKEIR